MLLAGFLRTLSVGSVTLEQPVWPRHAGLRISGNREELARAAQEIVSVREFLRTQLGMLQPVIYRIGSKRADCGLRRFVSEDFNLE